MSRATKWVITLMAGAGMFALGWWVCDGPLALDTGAALGIAAIPSSLVMAPLGWWAGRETPTPTPPPPLQHNVVRGDASDMVQARDIGEIGSIGGHHVGRIDHVEQVVVHLPHTAPWPPGRDTAQGWIDANETACGRSASADGSTEEARTRLVRVGVLPAPAEAMQPRERLIEQLGTANDEGHAAVLIQPTPERARVLSGLGGVGKSQLAASYARQRWQDQAIDVVVWANAGTTSGIVDAYAEAASELFGRDDDAEKNARRFLRWLASTPKRWLVVLDGIQTVRELSPWRPPTTATGQTVITTRYRGAALARTDVELIPVDVFSQEESRAYLHERLDNYPHLVSDHGVDSDLDDLASELSHLPLALAQASAYMINEVTAIGAYRALLADERGRLDELVPDKDELPDGHEATITATWSLSIQRANATVPRRLAWPLLQVAALLDPAGIPESVFTTEAISNYLTDVLELDSFLDAHSIHRGLAVLHRYNLITLDPSHPVHGIILHGLVQRATREMATAPFVINDGEPLLPFDPGNLAYATADAILAAWPLVDTTGAIGATLRANAAMLRHRAGGHLWNPGAHSLLFRIGDSLGEAGQIGAAITYFQSMYRSAVDRLDVDHSDTFRTRNNLARWRGQGGDAAGAVREYEQLLADLDRVLKPGDPRAFTVRGNLAAMRGEGGDVAGAVSEYEQLLADRLRILGPDDPDTLITRNNLAAMRGEGGDVAGAISEIEQLLVDLVRVRDPDHPDTLSIRHNLAVLRGEGGDVPGAVSEFEQLLADRLRVLGPDHPNTLITRNNLARWRGEGGDVAGAVSEYEQLLADRLRILGPDHPDTLSTRGEVAGWRGEGGDVAGAVSEYEQLLPDLVRVLSPDHPITLTTRNNLAAWRGRGGDVAGAAGEYEQLLADRLRILGPDHPNTLITRDNLAASRGQSGDAAGAVSEYEQLLADQVRVFGPDRPNTLTTRHNLAASRGQNGDIAGAASEYEQLLADLVRVFGPDHPITLTTRHSLAAWQGRGGDIAATGEEP
jgi:hypothetical protein